MRQNVQRLSWAEYGNYLAGFANTLGAVHKMAVEMRDASPILLPAERDMKSLAKQVWKVNSLFERLKRVTTNVGRVQRTLTSEEKRARQIARARALLEAEGIL